MNSPSSRRHRPQFRDALGVCAALCLMGACDGVGVPLTLASDGGLDGQAGNRASRDSGPDDDFYTDEATPRTDKCAKLDANWPDDSAQDELKLVMQMNTYRQMPTALCGVFVPPAPPFRVNAAMQCVARLRADAASRGPSMASGYAPTPTFSRVKRTFSQQPSQNNMEWTERQKVAGLDERSAVAAIGEVVISGASSFIAIAAALKDNPETAADALCEFISYGATTIGAGHSGNVWVLDFGVPLTPYQQRSPSGGR